MIATNLTAIDPQTGKPVEIHAEQVGDEYHLRTTAAIGDVSIGDIQLDDIYVTNMPDNYATQETLDQVRQKLEELEVWLVGGKVRKAESVSFDIDYIDPVPQGLYLNEEGNINISFQDSEQPVVLKNLATGIVYPFKIKTIHSDETSLGSEDIIILF